MRVATACLFMLSLAPSSGCVAGVSEMPSRSAVRESPDSLLATPEGTQRLFEKRAEQDTAGSTDQGYWRWTGTRYLWVVPEENEEPQAYRWGWSSEPGKIGP
jgi:hypothetical protein